MFIFRKFCLFFFLVTPVLRFALLPYQRRIIQHLLNSIIIFNNYIFVYKNHLDIKSKISNRTENVLLKMEPKLKRKELKSQKVKTCGGKSYLPGSKTYCSRGPTYCSTYQRVKSNRNRYFDRSRYQQQKPGRIQHLNPTSNFSVPYFGGLETKSGTRHFV